MKISVSLLFLALAAVALAKSRYANLKFLLPLAEASLVLYLLARFFFFTLYYPYRYLYPLSLCAVFLAGAGIAQLLGSGKRKVFAGGVLALAVFFAATGARIIPYNGFSHIPEGNYRQLLSFLESLPEDSVIAGKADILDSVPLFSKRSVFVNDELSIPFFADFYPEMKRRLIANARIYYSEDPGDIRALCKENRVTHIVVFKPDLERDNALASSFYPRRPVMEEIGKIASVSGRYFLGTVTGEAVVFDSKKVCVVDAGKLAFAE